MDLTVTVIEDIGFDYCSGYRRWGLLMLAEWFIDTRGGALSLACGCMLGFSICWQICWVF